MDSTITDLSEQLSKWSSQIEQSKDQLKNEVDRWQGYIDEYDSLSKQLETFADETVRPAMIPFGKLAFMPGKFIHTNEIMVYLGDQYYVERSTKQAMNIIENRKQGIEENLRLVQAQWNAVKMKSETVESNVFPSSEGLNEEGLPIMEIREELPSSSSNNETPTKNKNKGKAPAVSSFVQYDINKKAMDNSNNANNKKSDKKNDQDDLMSILDKLEQEEEEEEFQKQQQIIEKQLSLCTLEDEDDDNEKIRNDDDDIDDDLYDTEIADNIFDHFEDDEEYATQGVVDKEDFSSYHEEDDNDNENKNNTLQFNDNDIGNDKVDLIQNVDEKNIMNEVMEISVREEPLKLKTVSTPSSSSTDVKKNKKVSKFKQARLEQMKDDQKQDGIQTSNSDVVSTNNARRFKPKIPSERKNKIIEKKLPSTLTNSIPEVIDNKKDTKDIISNNEKKNKKEPILNEIPDVTSSSTTKKKVSRFKQYQDQQRQKTIESDDPTPSKVVETTNVKNKSKKGNPIDVPSRNIPNNANNASDEEKLNTKKKVSWGTTTSVREHDITSAPKDSEGVYKQPLKAAAVDFMNDNDDDSSRITNAIIRSPSDIFKLVKNNQPSFNLDEDGYPILDDENSKSTTLSETDIRDLASSVRLSEPIDMWRPANNIDEDELPILSPFKPSGALSPSNDVAIKKNKKMDSNIMRGAVLERETESLDLDEVEDDMDLREIKSSYQRQRQNILATMGGLSFDPKPEIEVFDDELPLLKEEESNIKKKNENKEDEVEVPKKVSRFKAARMAMVQPTTED